VNLTPAAQWRVDAGAWRNSGTTATGLAAGNHTVEYSAVSSCATPPSEVVTLSAGQSLTLNRTYAAQALFAVTLYPNSGQWRLNGGAWHASGGNWTFLDAGTYTIDYAPVTDYQAPPSETVTFAAGQTLALTRFYTYTPAAISMHLSGDNGLGRWRVDGGQWWPTNGSINVPSGTRTIEYLQVPGYTAPPTETVTLAERQFLSLNRSYVALPASLSVTLTPATARWRLDGGPWQSSGAAVSVNAGSRSVEYEHADFYISPEAESVNVVGPTVIARSYMAGAGDLLVHSNPPLLGARGAAQWRIDGGPWRACGTPIGVPAGAHTLEFKQATGLETPTPSSITVAAGALLELEADFTMRHRLRFFIKADLAAGLTTADLQARLSQYAAHFQTVCHRETARRFTFDPAADITICTADPFSGSYTGSDLPELGFEVWVYARLSDNPAYGTYGGSVGIDVTGAGGPTGLQWDRIYDASTLQPDTPEMMQYWRQIVTMIHECEHTFGAGVGEYYSLGMLTDPTGLAPILPTVNFSNPAPGDPFWGTRQEYWADPLLIDIYGHPRVGSPTSLPALLDTVRFAPASKGVIESLCRRNTTADTLPDMNHVKVRVVDATTGLPIPGATCRAWNRRVDGTYNIFEQTVVATATPGEFEFAWAPYPTHSPLSNYDNAKIVKAWAPGYTAAAQWESVYDAQKARTWDLKDVFEITIALTPQ
jgi:hypothetical protein